MKTTSIRKRVLHVFYMFQVTATVDLSGDIFIDVQAVIKAG